MLEQNSGRKIPVVGYCRFSSDMQREESIDAQKQAIRLFIQSYNSTRPEEEQYVLLDFYVDRAKSGKSSARPAFLQMIEDSKKKMFSAIIVHKLDRFSRDTVDTLSYREELNSRGVELISAVERIGKGPSGTLTLSIMASVNTYYSQNLGLEVMKGERQNAQKCLFNGGIPLLGYDIVDKKYQINLQEAKIVQHIFERYSQGLGYGEIIKELNSLGYKTKRGQSFGKNSLYGILENEKYRGVYIFNRMERSYSHGKRNCHRYKDQKEQIRVEGGMPRLISDELWYTVQALRSIGHRGKSHCKHIYLLSGLVYCGCGAKMFGNSHSNGQGQEYYAYRCSANHNKHICNNREIRANYLEEFVVNALLEKLLYDDGMIPVIKNQLNETIRQNAYDKSEDYVRYKNTLKMLNQSKKNLLEALKASGYSKAIGTELKDVEDQIARCEALINEQKQQCLSDAITEADVRANLNQFKDYIRMNRTQEIQAMLRKFVERVTVTESTIEVAFKAAFSFCNCETPVYYRWKVKDTTSHVKYLSEYGLLNRIPARFSALIHSA